MSNSINGAPAGRTNDDHRDQRLTTETKSALKTTEFFCYILTVIGIIIAAIVVGDGNSAGGDHFNALDAGKIIAALTIGYLLARGLAKSGSREYYDADRGTNSGR